MSLYTGSLYIYYMTIHNMDITLCYYVYIYVHCGATSTNTVQFMRAHLEACPLTCLLTPTQPPVLVEPASSLSRSGSRIASRNKGSLESTV